jgi:hypothetical protein
MAFQSCETKRTFTVAVAWLIVAWLGGCTDDATSRVSQDTGTDAPPSTTQTFPPETMPEDAFCVDDGWCWLEPSPFPHDIHELGTAGDRILGVAQADSLTPEVPFVWGDNFTSPDVPIPENEELLRLTVSGSGWLALTDAGVIYEFDGRGNVATRDAPLEVQSPRRFKGHSIDSFVLSDSRAGLRLVNNGEVTSPEGLAPERAVYFSDGSVWEVAPQDPEAPRFDDSNWRAFPAPPSERRYDFEAIGPSPNAGCASTGIWINANETLMRWNSESGAWEETSFEGPEVEEIGCDGRGHLLVLDKDSGLNRLVEDEWIRTTPTDFIIERLTNLENAAYIAGNNGTVLEMRGAEVTPRHSGLRKPDPDSYRVRPFRALWVRGDDGDAMVSHTDDIYRWSAGNWEPTALPSTAAPPIRYADTFWSRGETHYAIFKKQLLRWTGQEWQFSSIGEFNNPGLTGAVDIGGSPEDTIWLSRRQVLHSNDGLGWYNETPSGSSMRRALDEEIGGIPVIFTTADGEPRFFNGNLYKIDDSGLGKEFVKIADVPCAGGNDAYQLPPDTLYLATDDGCVAKRVDGEWTKHSGVFDRPGGRSELKTGVLISQPGTDKPRVVNGFGLLELKGEDSLEMIRPGTFSDGVYLPDKNATVLLHQHGILAKYH